MTTTIPESFSWIQPLGWALIHSLWQGLIILGAVALLLHTLSPRLAKLRYGIACAGFALIVVASVFTGAYIVRDTGHSPSSATVTIAESYVSNPFTEEATATLTLNGLLDYIRLTLQSNMPLILLLWSIGALFFVLRMVAGWWYIYRLQSTAEVLEDSWSCRLQSLALGLGIARKVTLAQSLRIHVPVVIGYIKPMVLIPVGMLAGLSTQQVEAIFTHELAHIRRHDYVINLLQSFVEAIFFFNPFVWILSGIIRREREYCCDDAVLVNGSPLAYAHALARLEEERLSKAMFALSLAENKNQLLYRIKRIMEKSANTYSRKDRLVPALLLVVGLICASWLTVQDDRNAEKQHDQKPLNDADTTIKKKNNSYMRSRTTVITIDENGEPHEEVIEETSVDGEPFAFDMPDFGVAIPDMPVMPTMPDIPVFVPSMAIPAFPPVAMEPMVFDFDVFGSDTIPHGFHYRSGEDWEEFSKAFEEKFRLQFEDFYKDHEKDFEKMMEDLEQNFKDRFNEEDFAHLQEELKARQEAMEASHEAREHMHEQQQERHEEMAAGHEARRARDAARHVERENKTVRFQEELKEMLVKDGYLEKDESIKTIHWDDDGEIKVNDKAIKASDREKYQNLHRQYFKAGHYRYVE